MVAFPSSIICTDLWVQSLFNALMQHCYPTTPLTPSGCAESTGGGGGGGGEGKRHIGMLIASPEWRQKKRGGERLAWVWLLSRVYMKISWCYTADTAGSTSTFPQVTALHEVTPIICTVPITDQQSFSSWSFSRSMFAHKTLHWSTESFSVLIKTRIWRISLKCVQDL